MFQQQEQGFIGSRLKHIPHSQLLYSTQNQLLLHTKRQIIRLDIPSQTLVYSNIDDQKVVHVTYHSVLDVFCILTDKHVLFVNQQGELIKKITNQTIGGSAFFFLISMDDGYKGVPNNREDFAIYVKGDYLYKATAQVYYERQMIKSKGICDFGLTIENSQLMESPQFIEHAKFFPEISMLLLWNTKETYIYKTPQNWEQNFERLYIYAKMSKRQNISLDYAISLPYKTLAVGFQSGVIKIFSFDESRKYILDLKGHQVACTAVFIPTRNPYLLYSASPDSTVRIWNIKDYEQMYLLNIDLLVKNITFLSDSLLFLDTDELKSKSYLCKINTSLLDPIVNDNRSGQLIKMRCDEDWCISIYSNQLVQFIANTGVNDSVENQKVQFPLQYGTIIDVFKLEEDLYAISLEKGFSLIKFDKNQIKGENFDLKKLVYNQSIIRKKDQSKNFIELIHQKLLDTYIFNAISDWKQIPTAITLSYLCFHKNKWLPLWNLTAYQKSKPSKEEKTYSVLGNKKGEIFFVDIQNRLEFRSKIHFHSQAINFIREIKNNNDFSSFLSMSVDRQICIWNLSHKQTPNPILNLTYNRNITYIQLFQNFLLLGQKSGEFNILQIQVQQEEVRMYKSTNSTGHLRSVICGDYIRYKERDLFLSGGEDSVIKIWKGVQKQMIFQLKLFGIVSTVNFVHHKLNLIVCHNEQISFIKQQKLKSLSKADLEIDQQSKETRQKVQQIQIKQFFFEEPISPLSPLRRGGNKRSTRYGQMMRKHSKIDETQFLLTKNEQSNQLKFGSFQYAPKSVPVLEQSRKKQKVKRFHAFSIEQLNKELSLPRIPQRKPNANFQKSQRESELVLQLKKIKNKSLSMAGRKPYS